ncbi:diaminopimelate epimerase, partial [Candidatus Omnitrophota bacterium]
DRNINMRTYERGVEGETLACGTGAVASAIVSILGRRILGPKVNVHTNGGVLKVYFNKKGSNARDIYLEGEAKMVYRGEVNYV